MFEIKRIANNSHAQAMYYGMPDEWIREKNREYAAVMGVWMWYRSPTGESVWDLQQWKEIPIKRII